MEDLKQAYEVLGLPETATKEELENRYFLLTRRARAQKMREGGEHAAGEAVDLDKVSEAYRYIRDYEENQAKAEFTAKEYGKFKGMAGKAQKWDHIFHYYKVHMLIGLIVLALIGYGIKAFVDHREEQARLAKLPPIDLSVMFYGEFFYGDSFGTDTEPLGEEIVKRFPDWQRVQAELTYVPLEVKSEQDMALIQKGMIVLIDNKTDLFILDKGNFEKLANQEFFLPLDQYEGADAGELPQDGDSRAIVYQPVDSEGQPDPDMEEAVYAIDLSGTKLGEELGVSGTGEYYAAVKASAARPEAAVEFILHYLNETK
ncbi:J domain-containing protein [Cohnella fermenti]|uniref:J domain-containing protein n=1 Tax=Cohnella fermenti TaxID=2565925 RepID=A0A4S4BJT9_9BACL|nr:J domain-containing protein [Cohnella fermenti]THF74848.1 J domain-containing protein [Cohnella fermenti]